MISDSITHHAHCNAMDIAIPARPCGMRVLSENELTAVSGAWNWGSMLINGLQVAVFTGFGNAAQAAYFGQPIGAAGIGGMIAGGVAGGLQGGLKR